MYIHNWKRFQWYLKIDWNYLNSPYSAYSRLESIRNHLEAKQIHISVLNSIIFYNKSSMSNKSREYSGKKPVCGCKRTWYCCSSWPLTTTDYYVSLPQICTTAAVPHIYLTRAVHWHDSLLQSSLRNLSTKENAIIRLPTCSRNISQPSKTKFASHAFFLVTLLVAFGCLPISFQYFCNIFCAFAISSFSFDVLSFLPQLSHLTSYSQPVPWELGQWFAIDSMT